MKKLILLTITVLLTITTNSTKINNYAKYIEMIKVQQIKDNIQANFKINPELINRVVNHIFSECRKKNVPPKIAIAIALRESRFNPNAISHKFALGIFQITPICAKHHNFDYSRLFEIEYNIECGVERLAEVIHTKDQYKIEKIVAMYGNYKRENMSTVLIRTKWYFKEF